MQLKCLFLICLLVYTRQSVLNIAQGKIKGEVKDEYISYIGIPYATITSDEGRFKRANLAPSWSGVRENRRYVCSTSSRPEHCLNLEVHVPTSATSPLPVLVWIKGGTGTYHPGKLVHKGVIVVFVNHRLGPLGFLCTIKEEIPGNAGSKDAVLALRWVRDNIVAFNGNPHRIVVAGQGYGAAMVEALMLSQMAEGLFHGVILQSGTSLAPWAFNYDSENRAETLAKMINNKDDDYRRVLLGTEETDLDKTSNKLNLPYFPFGLCLEKPFQKEERFLNEVPIRLLTDHKTLNVPMIIGYNSDEAYIFTQNLVQNKVLNRITNDISLLVPQKLKLNDYELDQAAKKIQDLYFKTNFTWNALLAFYRDLYFTSPIHQSVLHHASTKPVYYYQFDYNGNVGVQPEPGVRKSGAAHSDELAYLFPEKGRSLEGDDGSVQDKLINLWTNFVKHLEPTPKNSEIAKWSSVNVRDPRLLNIAKEIEVMDFPYAAAARMWDNIYEKYYYEKLQNNI